MLTFSILSQQKNPIIRQSAALNLIGHDLRGIESVRTESTIRRTVAHCLLAHQLEYYSEYCAMYQSPRSAISHFAPITQALDGES